MAEVLGTGQGVTYNPLSQLLSITDFSQAESRIYNSLGQSTQLSSSGAAARISFNYNFPAGTNNGKISSAYNAESGETISYQYDSLNRLLSAPTVSQAVNTANNQVVGQGYDATAIKPARPTTQAR